MYMIGDAAECLNPCCVGFDWDTNRDEKIDIFLYRNVLILVVLDLIGILP